MSLLTNWGYELPEIDVLPGLIDLDAFNEITAAKYGTDKRTVPNIEAASAAVRNYCGWHVFPTLQCRLETTFYDKRVTSTWGGVMVQLPATYVTGVDHVSIGGVDYSTYVIEPDGILRVYGVSWQDVKPWTPVLVEYKAGISAGMAAGLRELVAHRVTHALASTYGVQSEAAGGVSVTYNATWTNNSRATALADDNKEVLSPYRLRGVF